MSMENCLPKREELRGGFLRVLEIDASQASDCGDTFERIRNGQLQGTIVHGVYPVELLGAVVERLERLDPPFLQTWFPSKFRSWFFGRNLNLAGPVLDGYFKESAVFARQLEALFPPRMGLDERVSSILSALDRGRRVAAATGPNPGQHYMFATLRAHMEGGYIPAHFDNEQTIRPSYAHLRGLVGLHMTSFVLMLQTAEAGGTLEVYDVCCEPQDVYPINDDRAKLKPSVGQVASAVFDIPAGSMIILDSGRYLHRVSPVEGTRKRWTACSFMALSRQRDMTYCWG